MKVLKNFNLNELYLFRFGEEVMKVNFLLRQTACFNRDSPFFKTIFLNDWIEIEDTEISDVGIINRVKLLIKHLQVNIDNVEVFKNSDDSSCYLLAREGKFIQVNTKLSSLSDESDSLFLQKTYDLSKPEVNSMIAINSYNQIFDYHHKRFNSISVNHQRIFTKFIRNPTYGIFQ